MDECGGLENRYVGSPGIGGSNPPLSAPKRPRVSLQPLTAENWKECAALSVGDSQKDFVPSNLYSIAEAQFYDGATARAIYAGEEMVGFVLYGRDVASGAWKIFRLMVDLRFQGRGYGRAAMEAALSEVCAVRNPVEILVSFREENGAARSLYESLGFRERSREDGKVTAVLEVGVAG